MLFTLTGDLAMGIAARLDDFGKPAWISLTILAFWFWWPAGLALLAFLIGSGRMACWKNERRARWRDAWRGEGTGGMGGAWSAPWGRPASSGNRAFDEYRMETIRRLEEEQREFREFLDRLRFARDKAEFDQFLDERRRRAEGGPTPETPRP
jgi:hypothetical protein